MSAQAVTVNGRVYAFPCRPTVALTVDGCDPRYLDDALDRGIMPCLLDLLKHDGTYALARSHMPSFTNTNNISIVTGTSPALHGIPGNHYLAPNGQEVQLTDPSFLRAPSIFATFHDAGEQVLCVTAKDKLRRLLAHGYVPATSVEHATSYPLPELGIHDVVELVGRPNPGPYQWDMSHYALEIVLAVSKHFGLLDLVYISTTDFVQHACPPGGALADRFFARLDTLLGELLELGYVIGLVADHGMNDKHLPDGSPCVHYLEDVLHTAGISEARVILPITDPYIVHHGALGSFAWVHVRDDQRERARVTIAKLDGIEEVFTREEAAIIYQLPLDRIGDLSVASDAQTVLGKSAELHNLSLLAGPLRSHGGRHEQIVPIILSHPLTEPATTWLSSGVQNSDLLALLLNGIRE